MFIMTVWIRAEPGFEEWVQILNIHVYYIGIYILILAAFIVMVVSFLGCCSALMEHAQAIYLVSNCCVSNCLSLLICSQLQIQICRLKRNSTLFSHLLSSKCFSVFFLSLSFCLSFSSFLFYVVRLQFISGLSKTADATFVHTLAHHHHHTRHTDRCRKINHTCTMFFVLSIDPWICLRRK